MFYLGFEGFFAVFIQADKLKPLEFTCTDLKGISQPTSGSGLALQPFTLAQGIHWSLAPADPIKKSS